MACLLRLLLHALRCWLRLLLLKYMCLTILLLWMLQLLQRHLLLLHWYRVILLLHLLLNLRLILLLLLLLLPLLILEALMQDTLPILEHAIQRPGTAKRSVHLLLLLQCVRSPRAVAPNRWRGGGRDLGQWLAPALWRRGQLQLDIRQLPLLHLLLSLPGPATTTTDGVRP
jgi:hypothetical protein